MRLAEAFQTTTGTTAGSTHRTGPRLVNNQDAVTSVMTPHLRLGTVSDGCGSQPHSGYGSQFMVNVLPKLIIARYRPGMTLDQAWFDALYRALVKFTARKVKTEFLDPIQALNTHMMATVGGVIETPATGETDDTPATEGMTHFYGAGDFVVCTNNEVTKWKPEEGNKPLYPVLSLAFPGDPRFKFRVISVPTANLTHYLFGTDGVEKLLEVCADDGECIPGSDDPVGPINQIWTTDKFYTGDQHPRHPTTGPEEVDAWLNRLAQNWRLQGPAQHGGLLDDDTTFYAARRLKETVTT